MSRCPIGQCDLHVGDHCDHQRWSPARIQRWQEEIGSLGLRRSVGERFTVEPATFAEAVHTVLSARVRAEVGRQVRRAGLVGVEEPVVLLGDGGPAGGGEFVLVDPETVGRALAESVGGIVRREVREAVNALRGRVD